MSIRSLERTQMEMNMMLDVFRLAAKQIDDVPFLKFGFPVLACVGAGVFFYYGYRGIVHKSTISLGKPISGSHSVRRVFTGRSAQIAGVIYVISGVGTSGILGVMSYFLWF